jgi:hypothetical protein
LEHNWNRRGRGLGRECGRGRACKNYGRRTTNQLGHQCGEPIILTLRRAEFDRHVLAFDKATLFQTLAKSGYPVGRNLRADKEPDHRHRRLLRTGP